MKSIKKILGDLIMTNTYQCKTDIISKDERKQLLSQAMNCHYHGYETNKGTHTGLQVVSTSDGKLPLDGLVKKFVDRVNPKLKFFIADFIKFAPKDGIFIHKDDHLGRASCITWALYPPLKDFSPVKYYNEDKTFQEAVYYEDKPLIISTRNYHSCNNESEVARYTFQICFYDSIEKLAALDKKGELFI
tara:strand:+ start:4051 stop:4617 length:567 start_codon:yes stop_codon:yes gene_type:complete